MKKLTGEVTKEQIEIWKKEVVAKYGEEHKILAYETDGRIAYLRTVDRDTYSLAAAKVTVSPAKFNEVIIENIWLGGDDAIRKNDQLFFGLVEFIEELMAKKKGSLKEL